MTDRGVGKMMKFNQVFSAYELLYKAWNVTIKNEQSITYSIKQISFN